MLPQVLPQVLAFAFLLVSASTVAMIPVLQNLFGLGSMGWAWQHAALFAAMLGSTDCVAVSAVLKAGDGSRTLSCGTSHLSVMTWDARVSFKQQHGVLKSVAVKWLYPCYVRLKGLVCSLQAMCASFVILM